MNAGGTDVGERATPTSAVAAGRRLHTLVVGLALTLLVFAQGSGRVATDTKLDLLVAPWTYLRHGFALWDPLSAGGTLGDQAYGYAFPIGPFFGLGHTVGLAPWVVQRAWESAVVVAAFVGAAAVTRALVAHRLDARAAEVAGVAAGLAYALAPRTLTELTSISAELMPVAALPWVLLPLVRAGDDPAARRHAAALSGLALLFAGGVNATATLAILPVPAVWLLTRGARRWAARTAGWWAVAVVAACLWWVVPLLALGRYSPPFLDWIESAAVTTNPVSLLAEVRGVDHWQAYLGPSVWPAGWALVSLPALVLATTAVAAVGLAGLASRGVPHRAFLLGCLGLGLVLVGFGHVGPASAPWAGVARPLLDGPLVPFRNIHKFDPVIRLPLAVGVGYAVALATRLPRRVTRVVRGLDLIVPVRAAALAAVVAVGVASVGPALAGGLVSQGRSTVLASWWPQTATWLGHATAAEPVPGRALVVPGASTPVYYWGGTTDDALQPVAESPWTTRNVAPLAQAGYVRLLDVVTRMLDGRRDASPLPVLLARMGVQYVVLRNDLDAAFGGAGDQEVVRAALLAAGLTRAASFGPDAVVAAPPGTDAAGVTRPAVEVFREPDWNGGAALVPYAGAVQANGSSDDLADLVDRGLDVRTPVLFGPTADPTTADGTTTVLTDGVARRDVSFGEPGYDAETLAADAPFESPRAAHDYLPADAGPLSAVRYDGLRALTSSSSGARPDAFLNRSAGSQEWSALDGDPTTAWRSGSLTGAVGQWLQLDLAAPAEVDTVHLAFARDSQDFPSRVRITTDAGSRDSDVLTDGSLQDVATAPGRTSTIRVTVLATADGTPGVSVALATLEVPGLRFARTVDVPATGGAAAPDVIALDAAAGSRGDCLGADDALRCGTDLARSGVDDASLDRTVTLPAPARYRAAATVVWRPGDDLDALLDDVVATRTLVRASASSTAYRDPRTRPGAAVDGDADTSWRPTAGDLAPTLTLTFAAPRPVSSLRLTPAPGTALPAQLAVDLDGSRTTVPVRAGVVTLPAPVVVTTVAVSGADGARLAGVAEVAPDGAALPSTSDATVDVGCADGPTLTVDGRTTHVTASATVADVLAGRPALGGVCTADEVDLARGPHRLALDRTAVLRPAGLTLTSDVRNGLAASGPDAGRMQVDTWGDTRRVVRVDATATALLVVHENVNAAWTARLGDTVLAPVTVDGWEQAWVVPAGSVGAVELTFAPHTVVTAGLVAGLLTALGLLVVALLGVRRARRARPAPDPDAATTVVGEAGWPAWVAAAAGGVAALAVAGWWGLATAVAVVLAARVLGNRVQAGPWRRPLVVVVVTLAAGLVEAAAPAGSAHPLADSVPVAVLLVVALTLTALPAGVRRSPAPGRPPTRPAAPTSDG